MARKRRVATTSKPKPRVDAPGRQRRSVAPQRGRRPKPLPKAPPPVELAVELPLRIGHGWDLHRLEPLAPDGAGRPMVIGGVRIAEGQLQSGPVARSDGDVLLHAATDAILGALALPDIGELFPDTDARHEGADSSQFLREALRRAKVAGYVVGNMDATVICERPKIGPIKEQIRLNLARLLEVSPERVNVKGKTHERVDAVGDGRAIEAHAVVTLLLRERVGGQG